MEGTLRLFRCPPIGRRSVKMNHYYFLVFFVICFPIADFAAMPSQYKCDWDFDTKECLIRMYCYNTINWDGYLNSFKDDYVDNNEFHKFFMICNDNTGRTKIALVYKCDDHYNNEKIVPIPDDNRNLQAIYVLDLSKQHYNISPNLSKMERLNYLDLSHNDIIIANLSNINDLISLREINYSYNKITTFDVTGNYKYENLIKLIASHNEITTLPDGIFEQYSKLNNLDLSYNRIESLQIETFEGIKGLEYLNLSHNHIVSINKSMFRFKNLKFLNLSYNKLQSVNSENFNNLQNLESLDMSNNSIIRLEKTIFNEMPLLKSLNLDHNELDEIDKEIFLNNSHLSYVDLSRNNIHSLPRDLFKDKAIISFSIEENKLKGSLQKGTFAGLTFVNQLNLNNQLLSSIHDFAFDGPEKLERLLLNNNKINLLTKKSFRNMFQLKYLDLSNNKIADLSFEKDDLINLRHLLLQNNCLMQIKHDEFDHLNMLNFLNIALNNITKLEPGIFKSLRDLSYFEISNNPLSGPIEEGTFNGLSCLPKLDLSGTKFTAIKNNSFSGMSQLVDFNASHGLIDIIEYNTFINTGQIKSIDLSYNRLSNFLLNSDHLAHLNTLIINNNLLFQIFDNTFKGLYSLEIIDLGNNIIKNVSNNVFKDQTDLRQLILSHNNAMLFNLYVLKYNKMLHTLFLSGLDNQVIFSNDVYIPIKTLQLAEDGIKNVSELNLTSLSQLENIILKRNNISTLRVGDFSGIKSLISVDLSYNKITSIQQSVFEHNSHLTFLNVSHNMITELNYGIFRGLVNLKTLDLSFNYIYDLKSERFYDLQNLYELIVDHNNIDSFDAYEFNALGILSIGENPLPCDMLIKLNKTGTPFVMTAVKIEKYRDNFDGIACNINKKKVPSTDYTKFSGTDRILVEIRNELVKISNGQNSETSDSVRVDNNSKPSFDVSEKNFNKNTELLNHLTDLSAVMVKETNNTNILLQNILKKISYKLTTTEIPFPKDNATFDNILPYIKNIKQELENYMASEKENIMEDVNLKLSSLKSSIENEKVLSTTAIAPTIKLSEQIKERSGSLFTEICVGFILVILVGYILYKFYKSKLFIRPRRTLSTRGLEIPNL
ncbi:toll-like receptor 3 isoform X2 [Plodia interpunctella]|uniref:toll-like receptor 3 isoform X2 n=1 Tax=Plodia interpunctella TaxID=58824 RepID=UPI0023680769|nr:toll-like receptor 3 isoform X2 [Plodia interpunctella]